MKECLSEDRIQHYLDNELHTDEAAGVLAHISSCQNCSGLVEKLRSEEDVLSEALTSIFEVPVPSQRLRDALQASISELQPVREKQLQRRSPVAHFVGNVIGSFRLPAALAAAALVLCFGIVGWYVYRTPVDVPAVALVLEIPSGPPDTASGSDVAGRSVNTRKGSVMESRKTPDSTLGIGANRKATLSRAAGMMKRESMLPGESEYIKTIASLSQTVDAPGSAQLRPSVQSEYERNLSLVNNAIAETRETARQNPRDPNAAAFLYASYQSKIDLLNSVADQRSIASR